jgi:ribonuclease VapC
LIIIDASALVAIAADEPEREAFEAALDQADIAYVGPVNYLEAGMVLTGRGYFANMAELNEWLAELAIDLKQDVELGEGALAAFLRFGRGNHPASLNLGDCFAYALAKQLNAPLLYKGDDFAKTDITSALQPT